MKTEQKKSAALLGWGFFFKVVPATEEWDISKVTAEGYSWFVSIV